MVGIFFCILSLFEMKKSIQIVFLIFLHFFTYAQEADHKGNVKTKGFIITKQDTLLVDFMIPIFNGLVDYGSMRNYVMYLSEGSSTPKKLLPENAIQIAFFTRKVYHSLRSIKIGKKSFFFHAIVEGRVNLLIEYRYETSGDLPFNISYSNRRSTFDKIVRGENEIAIPKYYFLKRNGSHLLPKGKESLKAFFQDCPKMIQFLSQQNFKYSELMAIANYYNENCP
jgi:hypothetical protein